MSASFLVKIYTYTVQLLTLKFCHSTVHQSLIVTPVHNHSYRNDQTGP